MKALRFSLTTAVTYIYPYIEEHLMEKKLFIILCSVRTKRAGRKVADWVMEYTSDRGSGFLYELIDLKEIDLPFFDEPVSPRESEEYVHQHTRDWSSLIEQASGFIFVTPEYNHGYPPALKNAVDYLYREWKGKPAGFVGYGGSGARDSIRQIREVLLRFRMRLLENQVGISRIWEAFGEDGKPAPELISGSLEELLDELEKEAS